MHILRQVNPVSKMPRPTLRPTLRFCDEFLPEIDELRRQLSRSYHSEKSSCNGGCGSLSNIAARWRNQFLQSVSNIIPSHSQSSQNLSPMEMLKKIRPPMSDRYDEKYAKILYNAGKSVELLEDEVKLLKQLKDGQAKEVLEIGIGSGPHLKYYASSGMRVIGIDPVRQMEKYARATAEAAGLPPSNFEFINAVVECLPLSDASVDAVIGSQVLCSVKDVDTSLKEVKRVLKPGGIFFFIEHVAAKKGTFMRLKQNILNPFHRVLYLNCHLNRDVLECINEAGFSNVKASTTCANRGLIRHFVCGTAYKARESH